MKLLVLAIFGLPLFLTTYIIINAFLAAALSRNKGRTTRHFFLAINRQFQAFSMHRIWATVIMHLIALALLIYFGSGPLDVFWITLLLLGYIFVVSALTLSLLMGLPYFRQLWEDTFFKVSLLAVPIPLLYLAKGYAALWIGEIMETSAANVPMAHFAATSFFLLLAVAFALSVTALLCEVSLLIFAMSPGKGPRRRAPERTTFLLLLSLQPFRLYAERLRMRSFYRKLGIFLLLLASFLGCYQGFMAAVSVVPGTLSRTVISAIVFEFDAAPAHRCDLTPEERLKVERDAPLIKALFLAGTQDKAILMERQKNLFAPIQLRGFRTRAEGERGLSLQRTLACHVLK
ncbi:hypothetical protein M4R22_22080 [Acidovorax sp. GBBC 3334]|uniref:hypothetical protein n=1 Tax=Acidovorax sp. GBBC 3334 TaxID=2940496 RepID=UPI0023029DB4|nr:hypothetical protein [Acidovorax sp. GBBC 3334]MDA8457459.1 hypothetical protein [Acidovorax sp. GBBC 3334]